MVLFKIEQVGEVLQRLYDSEIDIMLSSLLHQGHTYGLGTFGVITGELQGPKSASITHTIDSMAFAAARDYPESDFSKWYMAMNIGTVAAEALAKELEE